MRVVHLQRRPADGQVSIERLFAEIRKALPADIECSSHTSPCLSRGIAPRLRNLWDARKRASDVNHILGDAHYLALSLPPKRTILTIHDCAALERLKGWKRSVLKWLWFDVPIRRSAIVTAISESTKRELVRLLRCDMSKIRVTHNCVGSEFRPTPKPFDEANPVILQIGTGWNKNLPRVIAALAGVPCRLHIIGRVSPEQRQALDQSRITYANTPRATDAEVVESYGRCDLVVFASTYEGFGLPILEANATGRPVITSNRLSMPEVAGDAACIVDPLDIKSIRLGVLRVCREPGYRDHLIEAGFANVKRFAPARVAAAYAALYRDVAVNAGNSPR